MDYDPKKFGIELERRLTLLTNGYGPVPLTPGIKAQPENGILGSKAPVLKGWHAIDYSADDIDDRVRSWEHHSVRFDTAGGFIRVPSRTTGMQGAFVALDCDVDDTTAAEAIMNAWGEYRPCNFGDLPIRTGKGHKFCVVARAGEGKTSRWPGVDMIAPDGETKGCVELFFKKGQIGVSGVHSYHVDANGYSPDFADALALTFASHVPNPHLAGDIHVSPRENGPLEYGADNSKYSSHRRTMEWRKGLVSDEEFDPYDEKEEDRSLDAYHAHIDGDYPRDDWDNNDSSKLWD